MKKLTKKNNKGFTLVELIVVVLIMAILAAALAPQVMKWVNHSRVSADVTTYDSMVSSIQLALADDTTYKAAIAASEATLITINSASTTITGTAANSASDELITQIITILGSNYTAMKAKSGSYLITIPAGTANIVKTTAPDGSTVK